MSMARIRTYLEAHPDGATTLEIAQSIECDPASVAQSLGRLETRGEAKRIGGSHTGLHATWIYTMEPTPPVFRAMETLRAMQEACRARLMKQPALEAA